MVLRLHLYFGQIRQTREAPNQTPFPTVRNPRLQLGSTLAPLMKVQLPLKIIHRPCVCPGATSPTRVANLAMPQR